MAAYSVLPTFPFIYFTFCPFFLSFVSCFLSCLLSLFFSFCKFCLSVFLSSFLAPLVSFPSFRISLFYLLAYISLFFSLTLLSVSLPPPSYFHVLSLFVVLSCCFLSYFVLDFFSVFGFFLYESCPLLSLCLSFRLLPLLFSFLRSCAPGVVHLVLSVFTDLDAFHKAFHIK